MPSSTSSSSGGGGGEFRRETPRGAWTRSAIVALVILLVAVGVWEGKVRAWGYAPCLNDSSDLWARSRSQVNDDPDQMVVIGSSRILFDLDLQTCADSLGVALPVQLAMPGTNPLPILEDLADNTEFRGILLIGAVPGLWMAPQGMPVDRANGALGRYRNWSPSQKAGLVFGSVLQKRLAFINADDLTLPTLLQKNLQLADRPGTADNLPPVLPPYFAWPDDRRQNRMWELCDFGTPLAARIQQIWVPLFTPPPPPPHIPPEEFGQMVQAGFEAHFQRIAAACDKLRARGARMVWVRPPSSGELREIEQETTPREAIYARMVGASGAPGIHFENHPELAGFECPEWSHLTARDAVAFTRALMPHVKEALEGS
ncbi:hypothetical protein KJ682_11500 [bacterium]|nr:hypothetical protein [bacterium]